MRTPAWLLLSLLACDAGSTIVPGAVDEPTDTDPADPADPADDTDPAAGDSDPLDDTDPTLPPLADPGVAGPFGTVPASGRVQIGTGLFATRIDLVITRPDGPGPYPVVVLTHGFQLSPANYASYARHLASWGYVVVRPQLPGSLVNPETHRDLARYLTAVLDWIDARAPDAASPLGGVADPSRLALSGHSMGGKISLLVAADDPRPDTAFLLDPVDAGAPFLSNPTDYPSVTPERMDDLRIPLGFVGETTNATGGLGGQSCAPEAENFQQYYTHAVGPALEVEVLGANHMSFLDDPACGLPCLACPEGTDDPAVTREIARTLLTAWLQVFLVGDDRYRPWIDGAELQALVDADLVQARSRDLTP